MPLSLNLYHEIKSRELERRRDPLKIGLMVLGAIAVLMLGFYLLRWQSAGNARTELKQLNAKWKDLDPRQAEARQREMEIKDLISTSNSAKALVDGRVFWAPILEDIVTTVPKEIELRSLSGDTLRVAGNTGLRITLIGVAAGDVARKNAEDFRKALQTKFTVRYPKTSTEFKSLDEAPDTVALDGKMVGTVNFTIQLDAQEAVKPEPSPTTPKK